MKELLIYAQAYIRLNIQRVIPILVIGLLLEGIFWLLMKKDIQDMMISRANH